MSGFTITGIKNIEIYDRKTGKLVGELGEEKQEEEKCMKVTIKDKRAIGTTTRLSMEVLKSFTSGETPSILVVPTIIQARCVRDLMQKSSPFNLNQRYLENKVVTPELLRSIKVEAGTKIYVDEGLSRERLVKLVEYVMSRKAEIAEVIIEQYDSKTWIQDMDFHFGGTN